LSVYSSTKELAFGNAFGTILLCLAGLLSLFAALMLQAMKELISGRIVDLVKGAKGFGPGEKQKGE
jgi:Ca2+/Na+ antiporter